MTNELVPTEQSPIVGLLNAAIAKGDTEAIKTLAEIYERFEAKRAEREFVAALLAFKQECPAIEKTEPGVHNSKFAPLGKIAGIINPLLGKHGLTYSFNTELQDKRVVSICIVQHVGGHTTRTTFAAPIDPAPRMTETHATASAVSLAQRYALLLALGVVTRAMDDDGQAATAGETISPGQLAALDKLVAETQAAGPAFWKFCKVERLEDLPAKDFDRVQQALQERKKRGREK